MNCKTCRTLAAELLLGELDAATAADVRTHLEGCADCRSAHQELSAATALLRDVLTTPAADIPVRLSSARRQRVWAESATPRVQREAPVPRWFIQRHPRLLMAAALMLVVVGFVALLLPATARARRSATMTQTISNGRNLFTLLFAEDMDAFAAGTRSPFPVSEAAPQSAAEFHPAPVTLAAPPASPPTFDDRSGGKVAGGGYANAVGSSRLPVAGEIAQRASSPRDLAKDAIDKIATENVYRRQDEWRAGREKKETRAETGLDAKAFNDRGDLSAPEELADFEYDSGEGAGAPGLVGDDDERLRRKRLSESPRVDVSESPAKVAEEEVQEALTAKTDTPPIKNEFNPMLAAREHPTSTFAIDVDTASYTMARNQMLAGFLPPPEAVRTEEFINFFDYDYEPPSRGAFAVHTTVAPSPFGRGLHLMKIGVKGRRLGREEQRPAVLTLLVDTSGSMNTPDRIGLLRTGLRLLLGALGPRDVVSLVQYDSQARLVLERVTADRRAELLAAIESLQCSGSTNLEEGLRKAYALAAAQFVPGAENRVLLLSDGVATLGSDSAEDILRSVTEFRNQGIYASVFGFGSGRYNDNMLETLANKGNGNYAFIDSEAEARRLFVDDVGATLNTIAADVKIQVEFDSARVVRYRQLGYENRQLTREQFRDDRVDAGEVGSGQSVTALYELELAPEVAQPQTRRVDAGLATVRVRHRDPATGQVQEVEHRVRVADMLPTVHSAPLQFRLAAGVAEFSEILRGSPFATGSNYYDVANLLRPVAMELRLDTRVAELLNLVERAPGLSRRQSPPVPSTD